MKPERRIDPDVNLESEEQMDRLERLIAHALAARVTVNAPKTSYSWKTNLWPIVTLLIGSAASGIYSRLEGVPVQEEQIKSLQQQVLGLTAQVQDLNKTIQEISRRLP